MSQRNGDKSRYHRVRKQNILRRKRTRELLQTAGIKSDQAAASKRLGSVAASKEQAHE
jgi:hypothetical protein